ncbi:4903_t:CDS:1, partial [Dentiscutata heterogama]
LIKTFQSTLSSPSNLKTEFEDHIKVQTEVIEFQTQFNVKKLGP